MRYPTLKPTRYRHGLWFPKIIKVFIKIFLDSWLHHFRLLQTCLLGSNLFQSVSFLNWFLNTLCLLVFFALWGIYWLSYRQIATLSVGSPWFLSLLFTQTLRQMLWAFRLLRNIHLWSGTLTHAHAFSLTMINLFLLLYRGSYLRYLLVLHLLLNKRYLNFS